MAFIASNLIANYAGWVCSMCQNTANIQNKGVKRTMSRQSIWATKVAALIQGGNNQAALAQIKVAPTVKDLQQLRSVLTTKGLLSKNRLVDEATADQIVALSAPRLHRSP
ncbi:hypothetical protein [Rhodoferax sp.]|uniref:hypothetical protein n=1 Tax=Rhodoferax sp. TaxID=50421 RepID=UPI002ACEBA14|nr:hypothetical protein [Rhodoferax sp.]MDZ7921708.1 hypothetical protein [Rhodoferax sp.]